MKNLVFLFLATVCLSSLSLTGCGGRESSVVEAPPVEDQEDPASAGMTEEEYNKAMEESMK